MKTLVFKLDRLSRTDLESIHEWLRALRWVWNEGLRLLEDLDTFTASYSEAMEVDGKKKKIWGRAPCCPVPWQYRRIDKNKPWGEGNLAPYTYWARKKPYAQFCRLPQDYREPQLSNASYFSLVTYFAHKRHPTKLWLKAVPSGFIRGTCHSLAESWARFKSGKGGRPRFKSAKDVTDTLINEDAKKTLIERINDRDGSIRIPKLGVFRVKHLWSRLGGDVPVSVLRVAKKPDAYYLQLTVAVPISEAKSSDKKCIITAPKGVSSLLGTQDNGKAIAAYSPDPKLLHLKEQIQKRMSRQEEGGKNWLKSKRKLGCICKRMAEQAKNYNQKVSTFIVRQYGDITLDGIGRQKLLKKPRRKERAKTVDPIEFAPNGAEAIATYNKHVASQRVGQFVALVKAKGKTLERDVKVVKSSK